MHALEEKCINAAVCFRCNSIIICHLCRLRELALGHIYLVPVQLVHISHDLDSLDGQQDEARGHFSGQRAL
jgi:hypothetical protein